MPHFYENLNVLVIPTDSCNLRCEYCFHNEYINENNHCIKMSETTLENMMKTILPNYKSVQFIWHGGEPLIMGIDFYRKVIQYQNMYKNETIVTNSIQTNLTLMSNEYAEFFKKYNFGVSSSFDGAKNEELRHNTLSYENGKRIWYATGEKSGNVMVVSNKNIDTLIDSYNAFKKNNTSYIMNPYTKSLLEETSQSSLEISGNGFAEKMIEFYEYWLYDTMCNIRVKNFLEILEYVVFKRKTKCNTTSCLGRWLCIRPDGTITPCNRYFPDEYSFGNVNDIIDIGQAFESEGFKLLLSQAIMRREKCKDCSIFDYCAGGCNNIALVYGGVDKNNNELCTANVKIFTYIKNSFENLVKQKNIDFDKFNPYIVKYIKVANKENEVDILL